MDYYYRTTNPVPFLVISIILGLILTILICILVLPEKRRAQLSPFFRALADIFNFKQLLLESILRFLYVLSTLTTILFGFFMLFMTSFGSSLAPAGLAVMFLGPIFIRLVYEFSILMLLLLKNVIEINKKTGAVPSASVPAAPAVPLCPGCGKPLEDEGAMFCTHCGYKLHE